MMVEIALVINRKKGCDGHRRKISQSWKKRICWGEANPVGHSPRELSLLVESTARKAESYKRDTRSLFFWKRMSFLRSVEAMSFGTLEWISPTHFWTTKSYALTSKLPRTWRAHRVGRTEPVFKVLLRPQQKSILRMKEILSWYA